MLWSPRVVCLLGPYVLAPGGHEHVAVGVAQPHLRQGGFDNPPAALFDIFTRVTAADCGLRPGGSQVDADQRTTVPSI